LDSLSNSPTPHPARLIKAATASAEALNGRFLGLRGIRASNNFKKPRRSTAEKPVVAFFE
jgi:hypothetical protein